MIRDTSLLEYVTTYALSHEIRDNTEASYARSVRNAERWAGLPLTVTSISETIVNEMILNMLRANKSPEYVRSIRCSLLVLWRDAAASGLCEAPGKVRSVRSQPSTPTVWSPEEVGRLIATARTLDGHIHQIGVMRAMYWESLVRMAWESGLRRLDLHRIRQCDITADFVWSQHKTKKPVRIRLRQPLLELLDEWDRNPHVALWPLWGTDETFRQAFRRLVARAGISMGPFKQIRKSAGTAAETVCPGGGHLLLGNTRAVFERNYLSVAAVPTPQPPELM